MEVSFSPHITIGKLVDSTKDPTNPKLYKWVYSILCLCSKLYIGEKLISINVRLKEHCADLRHDRIKNLALAEHAYNTRHKIYMDDAKIIAKEENIVKRKIR